MHYPLALVFVPNKFSSYVFSLTKDRWQQEKSAMILGSFINNIWKKREGRWEKEIKKKGRTFF
jgi:hypothetical protein